MCRRSGMALGPSCHELERAHDRRREMNSIATGITAALVSGVVMYTVGANAPVNAFNQNPALVQTLDGPFVPASTTTALRPAAVQSAPAGPRRIHPRAAL